MRVLVWCILGLLMAAATFAFEESAVLSVQRGEPAVFSPVSLDLALFQATVKANYSGRAEIRATDAEPTPIDELLYRFITVRSPLENSNYTLTLTLRVRDRFLQNNSLDENDIALMRLEDDWTAAPIRFIYQQGSYYYFNATVPFGSYAVIGQRFDQVSLGDVPRLAYTGKTIIIPIEFKNDGQNDVQYALAAYGAERLGNVSFDSPKLVVKAKSSRTASARVEIRDDAEPGIQSILLAAYTNTKNYQFPVSFELRRSEVKKYPSAQMIEVPANISVPGSKFRIRVSNPTEEPVRFLIDTNAPWADLQMDAPTIFVLSAGEAKEIAVGLVPLKGEVGEKTVAFKLSAEDVTLLEDSFNFSIPAVHKANPPIAIYLIILLVVFILIIRFVFRPRKERPFVGGRYEA